MIFVTVGTHEQQFNRLIQCIDELKASGAIEDEIIMQTGYCTYEPKYCSWSKLLPYKDMVKNVADARIVVTHGGPSSFIMPLQIEKIPIVVPRQKQFGEHVNDHQEEFVKVVYDRHGNIIPIYDLKLLGDVLQNYEFKVSSMKSSVISNNERFNYECSKIIHSLVEI